MIDIITLIFSKDRAMQVQAILESFHLRCLDTPLTDIVVLYTCSDQMYEKQYQTLMKRYPKVTFLKEEIFIDQVISLLTDYKYVLFLVDDTIFIKDFKLETIKDCLDSNSRSVGFSLRLGENTTYHYMGNRSQGIPTWIEKIGENVLKFRWTVSEGDFAYPLEVSSSVYRTNEILPIVEFGKKRRKVTQPNLLEGNLSRDRHMIRKLSYLLCFEHSVAFACPINKVGERKQNRSGCDGTYSSSSLAKLFNDGKKIDILSIPDINSCHQEVDLKFI
jgi:hypothetical protein